MGAVPVHLGCGIWGTIAVALFGDPELIGSGLDMFQQLMVQLTGVGAAFVIAFLIPYVLLLGLNRITPLRVSAEEEEVGLNITEHGARTDLLTLFEAMERQAATQDLALRIPVEPFTEVGRIATCYNQVMDALEESVSKTEAVIDCATDGILTFARDSLALLQANPRAMEMFALPDGGSLGEFKFTDIIRADGVPVETLFCSQPVEVFGSRFEGDSFPMEAVITPAHDMPFYMAILRDTTERKQAERRIHIQQAYFRQLFESSPQAISQVDRKGVIVNVNRGFEELFGVKREDVLGRLNRNIVVPEDRQAEAGQFNETVLSGRAVDKEVYRQHSDGRLIPVSVLGYPIYVDDRVSGIYYIYTDITERKAFEEQLTHQAFHDALTGLPNRVLFTERLNRAIKRSRRRKDYRFAAMMLDLDRFKWINDSLGHQAGDEFLVVIADRLSSCIREVDTVARLGGDEFGIIIEEYSSFREVVKIARRIQDSLHVPLKLAGTKLTSSASIGIVLKIRDNDDADSVMRDADIAMYRAKESGRGKFKVFNQKMHAQLVEEVELENDLRRAVKEEQFSLYYQPILSAANGKLKGFEALLRWDCPERGQVSPGVIIPMAEDTGLIVPLGQWVLREACEQMKEWIDRTGATDLTVSVNLSFKQFSQPNFTQFVESTLKSTGLSPANLKLELTESCLMQNPKEVLPKLGMLRDMGVQLVIDDFGTGYSSLSYLQQFPLNGLKIDRSFISGSDDNEINKELVKTIVDMAKTLKLEVVAEGVEESGQLDMLQNMSCDDVQGFMFSRPLSSDKVEEVITRDLQNGLDDA